MPKNPNFLILILDFLNASRTPPIWNADPFSFEIAVGPNPRQSDATESIGVSRDAHGTVRQVLLRDVACDPFRISIGFGTARCCGAKHAGLCGLGVSMKNLGLAFLFFGLLTGNRAFADEIFWVELAPYFSYQDALHSCSEKTDLFGSIYFQARIDNAQKVVKAEFRESNFALNFFSITFNAKEAAQLKFEKDALGDYWLTKLPLSSRLLNWLFFSCVGRSTFCIPRKGSPPASN